MKKANRRPTSRFVVLKELPEGVNALGLHPQTKEIIEKIRATRGKVLSVTLDSPQAAKRRIETVRRARVRKHIQFKDAYRKGETLYFHLR